MLTCEICEKGIFRLAKLIIRDSVRLPDTIRTKINHFHNNIVVASIFLYTFISILSFLHANRISFATLSASLSPSLQWLRGIKTRRFFLDEHQIFSFLSEYVCSMFIHIIYQSMSSTIQYTCCLLDLGTVIVIVIVGRSRTIAVSVWNVNFIRDEGLKEFRFVYFCLRARVYVCGYHIPEAAAESRNWDICCCCFFAATAAAAATATATTYYIFFVLVFVKSFLLHT